MRRNLRIRKQKKQEIVLVLSSIDYGWLRCCTFYLDEINQFRSVKYYSDCLSVYTS